jgi:hypothetical protein
MSGFTVIPRSRLQQPSVTVEHPEDVRAVVGLKKWETHNCTNDHAMVGVEAAAIEAEYQ